MSTTHDGLTEILRVARAANSRRADAKAELTQHLSVLTKAVRSQGHQGDKTRAILRSLWNGEAGLHEVGLCDVLAGLDHDLGEAILAAIAARLFLAGDADSILRPLLDDLFNED